MLFFLFFVFFCFAPFFFGFESLLPLCLDVGLDPGRCGSVAVAFLSVLLPVCLGRHGRSEVSDLLSPCRCGCFFFFGFGASVRCPFFLSMVPSFCPSRPFHRFVCSLFEFLRRNQVRTCLRRGRYGAEKGGVGAGPCWLCLAVCLKQTNLEKAREGGHFYWVERW